MFLWRRFKSILLTATCKLNDLTWKASSRLGRLHGGESQANRTCDSSLLERLNVRYQPYNNNNDNNNNNCLVVTCHHIMTYHIISNVKIIGPHNAIAGALQKTVIAIQRIAVSSCQVEDTPLLNTVTTWLKYGVSVTTKFGGEVDPSTC